MLKTGLVLEGGAMRGLFSAGILDVMLENGLKTDGLIGVSAGAAFGCNFKSGQGGRAVRYNKRFCRDPRYCSWNSWLRTGDLFGADFCYHELPEKLDPFNCSAYERNPMEFYLVCTDVLTGKAVYRNCPKADSECFEWMRASGSMPLVSRMVPIGGGRYLDGALADSIPLRFFESIGYGKNIVILTQPGDTARRHPAHCSCSNSSTGNTLHWSGRWKPAIFITMKKWNMRNARRKPDTFCCCVRKRFCRSNGSAMIRNCFSRLTMPGAHWR